MRFKETDIETHTDNGYGAGYPAVNVKVYRVDCDAEDVMAKFPGCTEEQASKALEFAFLSACESFWDYWGDTTGGNENGLTGDPEYAYFPGEKVRVYSAGRSGGWLIVQGLAPVEEWDAVMVARWAKFERAVKEEIKYRMSKESMLDSIEANEWWKSGSLADIRAEVEKYVEEKFGLTLEEVTS